MIIDPIDHYPCYCFHYVIWLVGSGLKMYFRQLDLLAENYPMLIRKVYVINGEEGDMFSLL